MEIIRIEGKDGEVYLSFTKLNNRMYLLEIDGPDGNYKMNMSNKTFIAIKEFIGGINLKEFDIRKPNLFPRPD